MELSLTEILMICFVALLVYGGRLPKVAMTLGRILGEFKRGLKETSDLVRYEVESMEEPRVRRRAPRRAAAAAEADGDGDGDETVAADDAEDDLDDDFEDDPAAIYGDLQEDPEPTDDELAKEDITLADDQAEPVESADPS